MWRAGFKLNFPRCNFLIYDLQHRLERARFVDLDPKLSISSRITGNGGPLMPPLMTATEMFEEMARRGLIVPASHQESFAMPSMLRSVPTITTYSTPAVPMNIGATNAGLEKRSSRDRD